MISNKLELETNRAVQCLKDNEMVANTSSFNLCFSQSTKASKKNHVF